MNRTFKSIFNRHTGTWQAVSETARAAGKTKSLLSTVAPLMILTVSALATQHAIADNLLVGAGGTGGSSSIGDGGEGGIGGGGGGGSGGGGGGVSGGYAWTLSKAGDGGNGGLNGGAGGAANSDGLLAGGNGNIGGGGAGANYLGGGGAIGGSGGNGGSGFGAAGGSNGGGGGGFDSAGQSGTYETTQIVSSYTHTSNDSYTYLGVGGGGGGGGGALNGTNGGNGQIGTFIVTGNVTINKSALIGGAGGGGGRSNSGGAGGAGNVVLQAGGQLQINETLLIGGSGGGYGLNNGSSGGNGGEGNVTVESASTLIMGDVLLVGGAKGEGIGGNGGNGILNLSGQLTFDTGAQFTINQNGTFNLGNATANAATAGTISGITSLTNNGVINFNQSNASTTFGTALIGSGSVNHNSTGTTILTGENTFTGGTSVTAGTLQIGNGGTIGSIASNVSVTSGATLAFNRSNNLSYAGVISGDGNMTKLGAGTLTLTGTNIYTGDTSVIGGTLQIGDGGTTGSIAGDVSIADGATLAFNRSNDLTVAGVISGDGSVVKLGTGTLTLSGINTYSGGTNVNSGTLEVSAASALGSGPLAFAGGNLRATGIVNLGSSATVAANTVTRISATDTNTVIFTQAINSGSNTHIHFGSSTDTGAIQLTGNAGSIGSNVNVWIDGGLVQLGNTNVNLISGAASTHIASSARLNLNGFDYALANLQGAGSLTLDSAAATISEGHFSGAISGIGGRVVKTSTGTLTLSGINTYTGGTIINAGTLIIASTGSLASTTTVNNSGTLGGTGSTGTLVVNSGGIIAPGNSIGTLTVNGNLTMNAGSIYQVEANAAGDSDKTIVNGTATLNGNVVALPDSGGTYKADTQYTILMAANPLIGHFNNNVTSSLAFLDASVSQDTNNVYLNLRRNDINYADVTTTRNQRNVATALQNTFAAGNGTAAMDDVLTSVNNLSADKARAAFESMSGGGLVGLQRAGANFAGNFSNQLNSRLQSAGMGRTAQSINGVQLAANDRLGDLMPALAQNTTSDAPSSGKFSMGGGVPVDDGKRGFWLRGYGFDQDTDGDGNAASTRIKGVGISAGFDKHIQNNLVVGAAFSHGTSDVRASFAETGKSRGNAIAAYASYATGPWAFNGNLMLAHNANTMNRNVTVGALTNTARANFDSKTVSAYGEASYDLPQATWTFQPLAGLSVTHNRNDGFSETGAGALNIQAASQSITSTKTLFGARALFEFDGIHVQPRAIWAHEFGDVNKGLTAQLQGSPAASFTTYGVDLPRDSLITGVTVAGKTKDGFSLFADVQGEFNSKQTGLALLVGMRKSW